MKREITFQKKKLNALVAKKLLYNVLLYMYSSS